MNGIRVDERWIKFPRYAVLQRFIKELNRNPTEEEQEEIDDLHGRCQRAMIYLAIQRVVVDGVMKAACIGGRVDSEKLLASQRQAFAELAADSPEVARYLNETNGLEINRKYEYENGLIQEWVLLKVNSSKVVVLNDAYREYVPKHFDEAVKTPSEAMNEYFFRKKSGNER